MRRLRSKRGVVQLFTSKAHVKAALELAAVPQRSDAQRMHKAHLGLRVGLLVIRPQAADALVSILKGRLQTLHLLQAGASTRSGGFI